MDKTISSESIIDPYNILQTFSLSEGLPSSKLDLLSWILSRIIWHLAKPGVRAHQRFFVYHRFIIVEQYLVLHIMNVCMSFV